MAQNAKYAKDQQPGFTNRIERVAIVGAGGSVGKYIAQELLKTGKHTVTALTRTTSMTKLPEGLSRLPKWTTTMRRRLSRPSGTGVPRHHPVRPGTARDAF